MQIKTLKNKGILDLTYYVLGDLFIKGMMFITLPLLTIFLTPAEYGTLSILTTMITFFAVLFSVNIENSVNNYYMRNGEDFGGFLYSNIIFIIFFQLIVFSVFYLLSSEISDFFKVKKIDSILVGIICTVIFYYNLYMLYLQGAKKSRDFSLINVFNKLLEIGLLLLLAWEITNNKYLSKIYAQLVAISIFLPYILFKLKNLCSFNFKFSYVKYSLAFSIPLIPHVLSNTILSQSDRVMINLMIGEKETGLYSFAYNLGLSMAVVISAWNSMWQPRFYELYNKKDFDEINGLISFYSKIISAIGVLTILITGPIVKIFVSPDYYGSLKIIPIIIASNALFFQYYLYVNYTFYHRKSLIISSSTLVAALVNLSLNYFLIPKWGVEGAAYATLIAYFILAIIHYLNAKKVSTDKVISLSLAFKWSIPIYFTAIIVAWMS